MEKLIYLVRHGQASAGTHNYDRLSDIGKKQAQLLGEHWRACAIPPAMAFAGSLVRQRDTAILAGCISADNIDEHTHHGLNEYDHKHVHAEFAEATSNAGPEATNPEIDLAATTSFEQYSQILSNWRVASKGLQTSAESWQQFKDRTLQAVIDCAESSHSDALALYSSGGAISVITSQIEQLPEADIPERIWNMHNASITTLRYRSGQLSVENLNEIDHLKKHADPTLLTLI